MNSLLSSDGEHVNSVNQREENSISSTGQDFARDQSIEINDTTEIENGKSENIFRFNHEFLSLHDHTFIKDADCSSSSSSGVVSGSTAGHDCEILTVNTDCLAYRAPWATPPTATFESNRIPPSSRALLSPSGSSVSSLKSSSISSSKVQRGVGLSSIFSPSRNDGEFLIEDFRESTGRDNLYCDETVRLENPI